jgi:hypothetical protein
MEGGNVGSGLISGLTGLATGAASTVLASTFTKPAPCPFRSPSIQSSPPTEQPLTRSRRESETAKTKHSSVRTADSHRALQFAGAVGSTVRGRFGFSSLWMAYLLRGSIHRHPRRRRDLLRSRAKDAVSVRHRTGRVHPPDADLQRPAPAIGARRVSQGGVDDLTNPQVGPPR